MATMAGPQTMNRRSRELLKKFTTFQNRVRKSFHQSARKRRSRPTLNFCPAILLYGCEERGIVCAHLQPLDVGIDDLECSRGCQTSTLRELELELEQTESCPNGYSHSTPAPFSYMT